MKFSIKDIYSYVSKFKIEALTFIINNIRDKKLRIEFRLIKNAPLIGIVFYKLLYRFTR